MTIREVRPEQLAVVLRTVFDNLEGRHLAYPSTFMKMAEAALAATPPQPQREQSLTIRYTNYSGETSDRSIVPARIYFGSTEWHPEEQWLLEAFDFDRKATRTFALKDVQWKANDTPLQHHSDDWWWEIIDAAIGQWGGQQRQHFAEAISRIKDVFNKRLAGLDEFGKTLETEATPSQQNEKR